MNSGTVTMTTTVMMMMIIVVVDVRKVAENKLLYTLHLHIIDVSSNFIITHTNEILTLVYAYIWETCHIDRKREFMDAYASKLAHLDMAYHGIIFIKLMSINKLLYVYTSIEYIKLKEWEPIERWGQACIHRLCNNADWLLCSAKRERK